MLGQLKATEGSKCMAGVNRSLDKFWTVVCIKTRNEEVKTNTVSQGSYSSYLSLCVLGVKPLGPELIFNLEMDSSKRISVIRTHCGNWSLGGVVSRPSSGWVRVSTWVLVCWVASENGGITNTELMIYILHLKKLRLFCSFLNVSSSPLFHSIKSLVTNMSPESKEGWFKGRYLVVETGMTTFQVSINKSSGTLSPVWMIMTWMTEHFSNMPREIC